MHTTSPNTESLVGIATLVEMLQRSRASIYRDIQNKTPIMTASRNSPPPTATPGDINCSN